MPLLILILSLLGFRPRRRRLNSGELEAAWIRGGRVEAVGEWRRC